MADVVRRPNEEHEVLFKAPGEGGCARSVLDRPVVRRLYLIQLRSHRAHFAVASRLAAPALANDTCGGQAYARLEMRFVGVRRLAALDMWGTAGSLRRRKVIRGEFLVGVIGCLGLGTLALNSGGWMLALGVWLVGAGVNYIPLAVEAMRLFRPGALEAELQGLDVRLELRRAGMQQLWIAVPFAVAWFALLELRRSS